MSFNVRLSDNLKLTPEMILQSDSAFTNLLNDIV